MNMVGKTAIITGAGQGIGRVVAKKFCEHGISHLVLVDITEDKMTEMAKDLAGFPTRLLFCAVDISDRTAVNNILKKACDECKKIDILVNNAGIADENEPEQVDIWHRVVGVNLYGTYYVTVTVLPYMSEGGRIINVSSVLGRAGKVRNTAYCASKHGILGFTKGLAIDLAHRKITVNAILPGWVDTPMLHAELGKQAAQIGVDPQSITRNAKKCIPLRRFVATEEVAHAISFLATESAGGITAQSITIDGGYTCGM